VAVAICIEVSHQRGAGHLFRSLVLAREMIRRGRRVLLVVNDCAEAFARLQAERLEFRVWTGDMTRHRHWLEALVSEEQIDLWVNDRLDTDAVHGRSIKALGLRLVNFDDSGEGASYADLNICALSGYGPKPMAGQKALTGEQWLILDPHLVRYRRLRTSGHRLLVTLGGSDTHGVTLRVVRLLRQARKSATILMGPLFEGLNELKTLTAGTSINLLGNVADMGALFVEHDLAITGGGLTAFEAAATGLPSIIIANERHEIPTAQRLEALGCSRFAGYHEDLAEAMVLLVPADLSRMSSAGLRCIPTDGIQRACTEILNG
jgi:spore coat polysaccharide biosynthesis predicted glycosyltransferase SpsG